MLTAVDLSEGRRKARSLATEGSEITEKALSAGATQEMILVMPNSFTRYQGNMYSNSVTTGNWEDFIAQELVAYVDSQYRTIPDAASRGLAGHSMGGYGVLRIGMKHPEMFSSLYALSPCCLTPTMSMDAKREALAEAIRNPEDVDTADFGTKAMIASAAAWSPNPQNPPLYLDLPIKDGQFQPMVAARWVANSPLALVDQYVGNLRRQRAIAFDAGRQDAAIAGSIKILDQILTRYEITHIYETYEGTHTNRVAERIEARMLPFFSKNLTFQRKR